MARKKKHHKKKSSHRRRVGAMGSGKMMPIVTAVVGTLGGLVAGRLAGNALASKVKGTYLGLGELVVGGAIAWKAKPLFLKSLGVGFAAGGAWNTLGNNGLKVLPAAIGYGPDASMPYRNVPRVGFPQPGNIGFPKPANVGFPKPANVGNMPMSTRYAGVY